MSNGTTSTDKLLMTVIEQLKKLTNKYDSKSILYDSGELTLPYAVFTKPTNPDNIDPITGYTQVLVKNKLGRTPSVLYAINNGPGTIFMVTVTGGNNYSASEHRVLEGERYACYNVDELRIRTTTANTVYILTENDMVKPKDVPFLAGRPYVSEKNVATAGVPNIELVVTDPTQGLGRNAHTGYIICDGAGNLLVQLSNDGTTFAPIQTVIPNQILNVDGEDIYTIKIGATVNGTKYRMAVH